MNSPSYDQEDAPAPAAANLTTASRRIREGTRKESPSVSGSVAASASGSAAITSPGKDPEYIPLHELAKGWKAAISWASDPQTRGEARKKNDRGNLPLHSAASFRAPVEVIGEFRYDSFVDIICLVLFVYLFVCLWLACTGRLLRYGVI